MGGYLEEFDEQLDREEPPGLIRFLLSEENRCGSRSLRTPIQEIIAHHDALLSQLPAGQSPLTRGFLMMNMLYEGCCIPQVADDAPVPC